MEPGRSSQTEDQPPALPAKQHRHRSHSYRGSSVGSDSVLHSPDGLRPPSCTLNDVFPESTECNAALCPIHHDVDSVQHQVRFLSDGTPPPVPRKRLVRTLSLPADRVPPLSPLCPRPLLQMHPQNFDNPLYMLTPIQDAHLSKECAGFGAATSAGVAAPALTLSQLCFDTPDDHLCSFFRNFEDQGAVSEHIQHRHLLFLRRMAHSIEAKVLMREEVSEKNISSYQPQDFLLDEGSEPRQVAETVYHSVRSPKFPGRTLGLRLYTQTDRHSSAYTRPQQLHVNVQNIVAHFQPTSNLKDSCTKAQTLDSSLGCTAGKSPRGGSNEYANYSGNSLVSTVQHLLWKGHTVSIERDLPLATLEDFVQESRPLQNIDCAVYDKQVCLLLLQILMGSQHLYNNSACAPELIPREILLVWPGIERNRQESSEAKINQTKAKNLFNVTEQGGTGKKEHVQMLWDTLGCPRVVITSQTSACLPLPQSFVSIKTQISALIQYCLNAQEGPAAPDMPLHRKGLLHLLSQLHKDNDSSSLNIKDMVTVLQVILWGPCVPLIHLRCMGTSVLHGWMTVKRALLVMKLAEKGLDHCGLDWDDFLCLHYLSFSDAETLISVTSQLE